jgi:starch synthase (maltosyl-transferring)
MLGLKAAAGRAKALGFNFLASDDAVAVTSVTDGLAMVANIAWPQMSTDNEFVRSHPDWFALRPAAAPQGAVDPRDVLQPAGDPIARYYMAPDAFHTLWQDGLLRLAVNGVRGFRFRSPQDFAPDVLRALIAGVRARVKDVIVIADIAGLTREQLAALAGCGFDFCLSSLAWWDFRQPWLVEEYKAALAVGAVLSRLDSDVGLSPANCREREVRLAIGAIAGSGLWMPLRFAEDSGDCGQLDRRIRAVNALVASEPIVVRRGALVKYDNILLRTPTADSRLAREALAVVVGPDIAALSKSGRSAAEDWQLSPLDAGLLRARRQPAILANPPELDPEAPRIVVTDVTPAVDAGLFAVKRVVGDTLIVEADIFTDGHPLLAAELVHHGMRMPMRRLDNDRWCCSVVLDRVGRHEFYIEAWIDRYGSFARNLAKRHDAGLDITLDLREGAAMVEAILGVSTDEAAVLLAPETIETMRRAEERRFAVRTQVYSVDADRPGAMFANWYELFPRSQGDSAERHGTFTDVIERLFDIRAMGFDVLYLPPVHPIGHTNRKGRNNVLTAGPGDPGSVYAIGSEAGGHEAVHPELGTLADFRRLVEAARDHGLEIALDFAVQCSPDHPWLKQHPGWFDWRADGSIKFAENPPKTYEDIVNVDFYTKDAIPGLWLALREIVRFWAAEGVRIFRVDNPHTKPFAFWRWLIASIRATDPDVIFLAEAFTRPKVMYHLAKLGFTQSYTYFTWRNTKEELTQYLMELNAAPARDFFRPHFFVNTPDINPFFLQTSGRSGFLIRAALAATLSGLWGIYSGFELCEAAALPGREEYNDSEKYALRLRDWRAPGNIIAEIAILNRLRNAHPALQSHLGVIFYNAFNPNILYFAKHRPGETSRILVMISLNPHSAEACDFEIPLWEWNLPDSGAVLVEDLLGGGQFIWHGKIQHVRLAPDAPYRIWRVCPAEDQQ